ncbi:MAG: D-alanine--D-alanine ligase family protein [Patescibacteria group bacterium]|nr:D-alanine--D-alanine ligase family protein [Patescibacteria group bacterium]
MAKRISLAVVFGGRSGEHEVSIASAKSVVAAFNKKRYDIVPIRIAKDGIWYVDYRILAGGARGRQGGRRIFPSCPAERRLRTLSGRLAERIDIAFAVMHGTYGEDGAIQGLFEIAGIPYVGSGVPGSSIGMDKAVSKVLLAEAGIPTVDFISFKRFEWEADGQKIIRRAAHRFGFPNFVKPVNLGSSVGITKAHNRKELTAGIKEALKYDEKIIIERVVEDAREIECAILGNNHPIASVLGEIIPSNEFYDYSAKYLTGKSGLVIPAELPDKRADKMRKQALQAFRILEAEGLARVDFLMDSAGNHYLNEINTMPGFTKFSMFPRLWAASGLSYSRLLDKIVRLAFARAKRRSRLKRNFS